MFYGTRQRGIRERGALRGAAGLAGGLTAAGAPASMAPLYGYFANQRDAGLRGAQQQTLLHYGIRRQQDADALADTRYWGELALRHDDRAWDRAMREREMLANAQERDYNRQALEEWRAYAQQRNTREQQDREHRRNLEALGLIERGYEPESVYRYYGLDGQDQYQDPSLLPRRALGGPVRRGRPYWVGEQGPEVFVPDESGQVIPMTPTGAAPPAQLPAPPPEVAPRGFTPRTSAPMPERGARPVRRALRGFMEGGYAPEAPMMAAHNTYDEAGNAVFNPTMQPNFALYGGAPDWARTAARAPLTGAFGPPPARRRQTVSEIQAREHEPVEWRRRAKAALRGPDPESRRELVPAPEPLTSVKMRGTARADRDAWLAQQGALQGAPTAQPGPGDIRGLQRTPQPEPTPEAVPIGTARSYGVVDTRRFFDDNNQMTPDGLMYLQAFERAQKSDPNMSDWDAALQARKELGLPSYKQSLAQERATLDRKTDALRIAEIDEEIKRATAVENAHPASPKYQKWAEFTKKLIQTQPDSDWAQQATSHLLAIDQDPRNAEEHQTALDALMAAYEVYRKQQEKDATLAEKRLREQERRSSYPDYILGY